MIPKEKEKAEELVGKFINHTHESCKLEAKQCALIAVNEIIDSRPAITDSQLEYRNYWQQVKLEIERL
jgi:hypothetical protein